MTTATELHQELRLVSNEYQIAKTRKLTAIKHSYPSHQPHRSTPNLVRSVMSQQEHTRKNLRKLNKKNQRK